jgi:hypothetical protein
VDQHLVAPVSGQLASGMLGAYTEMAAVNSFFSPKA